MGGGTIGTTSGHDKRMIIPGPRVIDSGRAEVEVAPMSSLPRAQAYAFYLLSVLPLAMAIANRSAPALLVAAALCSVLGRILVGEGRLVWERLDAGVRSPAGLAGFAFVGFAVASVAWSHEPRLAMRALGEAGIALAAASLLGAGLPRDIPRTALRLAAVATILGCGIILAELSTGLAGRAALGLRAESYIFKRSVTSILIVFWPVASSLWRSGDRALAALPGLLLLAAILGSHAAAALLGLAAGLVCFLLACAAPRVAAMVTAGGVVAAFALAPIVGDFAARTLPDRALDTLRDSQARERILIWQSFGSVVRARPIGGTGFGTSGATGRDPVAGEVPDDRRTMLAVGHPHNGFLQIWSETGAAGAVAGAAVLLLLVRKVSRWPKPRMAPALAVLATASAVMLVAHGAWQGWWIATLGAAAIWLARGGDPPQSSVSSALPRKPIAST